MDAHHLQQTAAAKAELDQSEHLLLRILGAITFAILTSLAAQIRIPLPFTPIPMTLQTFIVPLAGGFLGAFWGTGSMLIYVLIGMTNLIGFAAAPGGMQMFFAPSAGYILGFIVAALMTGFAKDRKVGNSFLFLILLAANILILALGATGLIVNSGMNLAQAWNSGVAPFIAGGIVKLTASYLVLVAWRSIRNETPTS